MYIPSVSFAIRSYQPLKNGNFIVRLRIIYMRKVKFFSIGLEVSAKEWKNRWQIKKLRDHLTEVERKAAGIIESLKPFDWQRFEMKFRGTRGDTTDVYWHMEQYKELLEKQERIGSWESYGCALISLQKFRTRLSFDDLTVDFLQRYEKWMLKQGRSLTTVGLYLRNVRTIMNSAIRQGITSNYPFGRSGYVIPTGKGRKLALQKDKVELFKDYKPADEREQRCLDYWLYSYFANGINMKDVLLLKPEQYKGDFITLQRAKTILTSRSNPLPIQIYIGTEMKAIVKRQGAKKGHYIFPVLNDNMDAKKKAQAIAQHIKNVNKGMNSIAEKLGIDINLTTYVARHSNATIKKRAGVTEEAIAESLGHGSVATTRKYLDSFEREQIKKEAEVL